jgi:hypothetical protein
MDPTPFLPFPMAATDPLDRDLAEIDAGIAMVSLGLATRVRLVGLARPEAAASSGLAHAQAADVRFSLDRGPSGVVAVTLGPRV